MIFFLFLILVWPRLEIRPDKFYIDEAVCSFTNNSVVSLVVTSVEKL